MIIIVFGDSIAYGAWDEEGGWVERLKRYMHRRAIERGEYHLVYNLAISGETSWGILERLEAETASRLEEGEKSLVILQIGMNDSALTSEGPVVQLEEFETNVSDILQQAREIFDEAFVLGLFRVDEERTNPVPWAPLWYKNERIKAYDEALRRVSEKRGAKFIPLMNLITLEGLADGIHPNSRGHQKIFETTKQALRYLLTRQKEDGRLSGHSLGWINIR